MFLLSIAQIMRVPPDSLVLRCRIRFFAIATDTRQEALRTIGSANLASVIVSADSCSKEKPQPHQSLMIGLLILVLLCSNIVVSSGTVTPKCTKPSLRKEWRALGYDGQKAFIDAIKASFFYFYTVILR